jgi:hypothetical protein
MDCPHTMRQSQQYTTSYCPPSSHADKVPSLMRPVIDRSSLSTTPTTLDYGAMGSTSTSALGLTAVQESGRSRNHSRSRSSSATRVYETDSFGKWSISTTSTRVDKEEEQPKEPKELKNACAGHWTETMTSTLQGHQNGIPTRYGTPPAGQTAAAMAPTPKPWYDEIFTHPPPQHWSPARVPRLPAHRLARPPARPLRAGHTIPRPPEQHVRRRRRRLPLAHLAHLVSPLIADFVAHPLAYNLPRPGVR